MSGDKGTFLWQCQYFRCPAFLRPWYLTHSRPWCLAEAVFVCWANRFTFELAFVSHQRTGFFAGRESSILTGIVTYFFVCRSVMWFGVHYEGTAGLRLSLFFVSLGLLSHRRVMASVVIVEDRNVPAAWTEALEQLRGHSERPEG